MKDITVKMVKIIILNKKEKKKSEIGARQAKATYSNSEIGEKVTLFVLWE